MRAPLSRAAATGLVTAALSFASCAGFSDFGSDDLRGGDRSAFHTRGRVSMDIWNVQAKREDGQPGGESVRAPWGPVSMEFGFDAASGDFHGPSTASWSKTDYDLLEVTAAARSGIVFGADERVVLRGLLGVGWNHASFDVDRRTAPSVNGDSNRLGVVTGVELAVRPWNRVQLYGRSTVFLSVDTASQKAEAGLEIDFTEQIFGHIGWRHWSFARDDLSLFSGSNNIDIRSQGILLGFGLRF